MNNPSYFSRLWNSLLAIFRSPESVGKQFIASRDYLLALGYILIQTLFTALFGLITVARINGAVNSMFGLLSEFGSFSIPVGVGFGFGALFYFIEALFLALFAFAFSKAFKSNAVDFKGGMVVAALQSIFAMPGTLIAFIVAAINPSAGLFVYSVSKFFGLIVVSKDMPNDNQANQEKTPLMVFLAYACAYIVTALIAFLIFYGIIVAAIGSIGF